jgi:hypothetical protein
MSHINIDTHIVRPYTQAIHTRPFTHIVRPHPHQNPHPHILRPHPQPHTFVPHPSTHHSGMLTITFLQLPGTLIVPRNKSTTLNPSPLLPEVPSLPASGPAGVCAHVSMCVCVCVCVSDCVHASSQLVRTHLCA